jgi:hypothetical protein
MKSADSSTKNTLVLKRIDTNVAGNRSKTLKIGPKSLKMGQNRTKTVFFARNMYRE